MSYPHINPAKGTLLIAEPFLGDPSFDRSVILITDHNNDGTVGFVLNRPLDLKVQHVLDEFPDYNPKLFYGGPVQQNNLYFLHTQGKLVPDSIEIVEGLYWGGQLSAIKELIRSGLIKDDDIRFYLGYSGWGKQQLIDEIDSKSWMVVKSKRNILTADPKTLWKELLIEMGGDYMLWANSPSDPILN